MSDLIAVTRAETAKMLRRPATWTLLGAAALLAEAFAFLVPYLSYRSGSSDGVTAGGTPLLASTLPDQVVVNTTAAFPVFTGALALVLGALVSGGEYSHGTVKTLFTQRPRRATVISGQLIAAIIAVGLGVLALYALSATNSAVIAAIEDAPSDWPSLRAQAQGLAAGWAIMAMWTALGVMLGTLLRSMALPIGLGVVWILGIENLVSSVAGSLLTALEPLRDVLPGVNAGSLLNAVLPAAPDGMPPGVQDTVSGGRGLLTVGGYVLAAAVVLIAMTNRRDVT